jgi:hypothetical protein
LTDEFDSFIKEIFPRRSNSVCIVTLGKKQSGKTNFMLHLMDTLHRLGLMDRFGSNMPMEAPFEVDFIEDFQTLEQTCKMLNPDPKARGLKRYFFFGSEMGKWLAKDTSWENTKFLKKLQTIRKNGLSFCGDAIDRVDSRALNETHFEGAFIKYNVKNPTVASYENWQTGEVIYLTDIPKTRIKFDTYYSADFYMEPQVPAEFRVPLNQEHQMIQIYKQNGHSWDKTEYSRTQGKRAIDKVIDFHFANCLHSIQEPSIDNDVSEPSEPS